MLFVYRVTESGFFIGSSLLQRLYLSLGAILEILLWSLTSVLPSLRAVCRRENASSYAPTCRIMALKTRTSLE
jgi:hypothetical protein